MNPANVDPIITTKKYIFIACISLFFPILPLFPGEANAQGAGLYKNGVKILGLEEQADSSLQTLGKMLPSTTPRLTKGQEFRMQTLGQKRPNQFKEQNDYFGDVISCRDLVLRITSEDGTNMLSQDELEQLLALKEDLIRKNLALLAKYEWIATDFANRDYPAEKLDRHTEALEQHRSTAKRLQDLLTALETAYAAGNQSMLDDSLRGLRRYFLDHIFREAPRLINSRPSPVALETKRAPVIQYDDRTQMARIAYPSTVNLAQGYDPEDLDETIDVQFTDEITALAAELNHSPVEIYHYIRNNFTFEPYLGSRKGASQTLEHMRGNDYDQASLMIALLRVSGIPARYATGAVEMPIDRATNWLGIDDKYNAGSILTTCGMEGIIHIAGVDTVAISCKRVWVEAFIPFVNYRGSINDSTGFMWVPIDPVFKQHNYSSAINLPAEIGFDAEGFVRDYYSTFHSETPGEFFKQALLDTLAIYHPDAAYEDLIRTQTVVEETDGILPGTLPYDLLSFDGTFSEIPAEMRYKISFDLHGGGISLFYETSLPEIVQKQATISYVGATPTDSQIIDTAGGIFNVQLPYLVDVKPVLKIDGCEVARGSGAIMLGKTHTSEMHFTPPVGAQNQIPTVSNDITAGNYQGIGIDTEDAFPALFGTAATTCEEAQLGQESHQLALTYLNEVDKAGDEIAQLMHQVVMNDVSEAIVENSVTVNYDGGGNTQTMNWTGMIVDADRKIIGPFSVDGVDNNCDYMRLGGADGSIQENRLFEVHFEEEAISAIKILELASDSGIAICEITHPGIYDDCPGFDHPAEVESAILSALGSGHHVIIPERTLAFHEWIGTGYIDIDPTTCAAGYIISGGQNGGATVCVWDEPWFVWLLDISCMKYNEPIDVIPSATNDMYSANSWAFWTFVVWNLDFYGKDEDGNCHKKFTLPRFFVVPKTIKAIADRWGPGEYTFKAEGATSICSECTGAEKKVTIFKVEMITPAGDPVGSPVESGDGQNEFTYSTATPGVLTMNLKAKVTPSGAAAKIKDQCHYTVGAIGSSTQAWDAANPGGKPTASGDFLQAKVTFTTLPTNNSDFGRKKAAVYFNGSKQDEENYEVFFPKSVMNHSGAGAGSTPNWYYYWATTAVPGYDITSGTYSYANGAAGDYAEYNGNPTTPHYTIHGPASAGHEKYNSGGLNVDRKGINTCAATLVHEKQHRQTDLDWRPGGAWHGKTDTDGDEMPDDWEDARAAQGFDKTKSSSFTPAFIYGDDEEVWCEMNALGTTGVASKDWANPGKQSKNVF